MEHWEYVLIKIGKYLLAILFFVFMIAASLTTGDDNYGDAALAVGVFYLIIDWPVESYIEHNKKKLDSNIIDTQGK